VGATYLVDVLQKNKVFFEVCVDLSHRYLFRFNQTLITFCVDGNHIDGEETQFVANALKRNEVE